MTTQVVRRANREDLPAIEQLLHEALLPVQGVHGNLEHFSVAEQDGGIVGVIGLEVYEDTGLLRSLAVRPSEQRRGIGGLLCRSLLRDARDLGLRHLVLLTTTAEKYFSMRGFRTIDRKRVTGEVTRSVEFTEACPSTAVCMELFL
jgi:amino-acid N-acetyltransferase